MTNGATAELQAALRHRQRTRSRSKCCGLIGVLRNAQLPRFRGPSETLRKPKLSPLFSQSGDGAFLGIERPTVGSWR